MKAPKEPCRELPATVPPRCCDPRSLCPPPVAQYPEGPLTDDSSGALELGYQKFGEIIENNIVLTSLRAWQKLWFRNLALVVGSETPHEPFRELPVRVLPGHHAPRSHVPVSLVTRNTGPLRLATRAVSFRKFWDIVHCPLASETFRVA